MDVSGEWDFTTFHPESSEDRELLKKLKENIKFETDEIELNEDGSLTIWHS